MTDLHQIVNAVGLVNLLDHGSGSCVYSEGCAGVTQQDLERLVELMRVRVAELEAAHEDASGAILQAVEAERERVAEGCARIELVVAVHTLASHFENALYAFGDDCEARRKAEGDIAHAMKVAARHNYNGAGCRV